MSGRHRKQKKQHRTPNVLIGMPEKGPTEIPANPYPEDEDKNTPKYSTTVGKPPESTLAWWGLLTGIVVAAIYGFQLHAMLESNKINRDALQSVQRAFVTFSPSAGVGTSVRDKKVIAWSAQIPMTNSGTTPTRGMLDRANVLISQQEMPGDFDFHDTGKPGANVLGPKDTNSYGTDLIPIEAIQAVQHEAGHVYVYGWATYNDVFPQTKRHITKFCYELHVNTIAADLTDPKYLLIQRFTLCPVHNCTDEECGAEKPN